jgi:hypothetical protein
MFLRSLYRYVNNAENMIVKVLYTYTNDEYKRGYELLIKKLYNQRKIRFKLENDFKKDLLNMKFPEEYTMFFMDDNLFIRPFSFTSIFYDHLQDRMSYDSEILCLSLGLNYYLDYCYPAQMEIKKRPFFDRKGCFEWKGLDPDYGYPMSLDGHIYRTKEILPLLQNLNYTNPNSLEGQLALNPIDKPKILCYPESRIINLAINRVQTNNFNHCGNIDAEGLNTRFLAGDRGKIDRFDEIENTRCHLVVDWI